MEQLETSTPLHHSSHCGQGFGQHSAKSDAVQASAQVGSSICYTARAEELQSWMSHDPYHGPPIDLTGWIGATDEPETPLTERTVSKAGDLDALRASLSSLLTGNTSPVVDEGDVFTTSVLESALTRVYTASPTKHAAPPSRSSGSMSRRSSLSLTPILEDPDNTFSKPIDGIPVQMQLAADAAGNDPLARAVAVLKVIESWQLDLTSNEASDAIYEHVMNTLFRALYVIAPPNNTVCEEEILRGFEQYGMLVNQTTAAQRIYFFTLWIRNLCGSRALQMQLLASPLYQDRVNFHDICAIAVQLLETIQIAFPEGSERASAYMALYTICTAIKLFAPTGYPNILDAINTCTANDSDRITAILNELLRILQPNTTGGNNSLEGTCQLLPFVQTSLAVPCVISRIQAPQGQAESRMQYLLQLVQNSQIPPMVRLCHLLTLLRIGRLDPGNAQTLFPQGSPCPFPELNEVCDMLADLAYPKDQQTSLMTDSKKLGRLLFAFDPHNQYALLAIVHILLTMMEKELNRLELTPAISLETVSSELGPLLTAAPFLVRLYVEEFRDSGCSLNKRMEVITRRLPGLVREYYAYTLGGTFEQGLFDTYCSTAMDQNRGHLSLYGALASSWTSIRSFCYLQAYLQIDDVTKIQGLPESAGKILNRAQLVNAVLNDLPPHSIMALQIFLNPPQGDPTSAAQASPQMGPQTGCQYEETNRDKLLAFAQQQLAQMTAAILNSVLYV